MDGWILSFIIGCMSALFWHWLPAGYMIPILCCASILLLYFRANFIAFNYLSGLIMGIAWMASVGHWSMTWQLPSSQIQTPLRLEGKIITLNHSDGLSKFNVEVFKLGDTDYKNVQPNVRLTWYQPQWTVKQGQLVSMVVNLKPPHGLANEAGFNFQQWLFTQNIIATGYVVNKGTNILLKNQVTLRQKILDNLIQTRLDSVPWLAALSLGYRGLLTPQDWALLKHSGTAHLVAISGLHLAVVSSIGYFVFGTVIGLFCGFLGAHQINTHKYTLVATLGFSFLYMILAGMSLPTVRAWSMLCIVTIGLLLNRNWNFFRLLLCALLLFMVLFPQSIYGASFWLSFGAILILWFVFWRWPVKNTRFSLSTFFASMLRVQVTLSLLMIPVVAQQFGGISLISPIVNLLAVPLVTLILVPLCLISLGLLIVAPTWAPFPIVVADVLMRTSIDRLTVLADMVPLWFSVPQFPLYVWLSILLYFVFLLLPPLPIRKVWCLGLCLPLLSYSMSPSKPGWQIDILDVGHGLSVLISKEQHLLLYDTGANYPTGFSIADSVLLPVFRGRGQNELDRVYVSHDDNDHSGGLTQLSLNFNIHQVFTTKDNCIYGNIENWHGLTIKVLWPMSKVATGERAGNNDSCVVHISDGATSLLLTGDIELESELAIVERFSSELGANILVAPHHGSNTSSSEKFLEAVSPDYVVFSQGYLNRWRFPTAEVQARYEKINTKALKTSEVGQVRFLIDQSQVNVITARSDIYPYWYANY